MSYAVKISTLVAICISFVADSGILLAQNDSLKSTPSVTVIAIKGAIGPTTTNYIRRGLEEAVEANDEALIIQLDTILFRICWLLKCPLLFT